MSRPRLRVVGLALALALAAIASVARADGEAGLVIQHGDGTTETFCIAFQGDSITGDQLLRRAGVPVEQFSGLVCALGTNRDEGCFGASSFDSCTCKCQGSNCSYWAFFAQQYGKSWVYSALGFLAQKARDGDMQAWKWGRGASNSAPAPAPITFEQVCGHPPGAASQATSAPAASTPPSTSPGVVTGTSATTPGGAQPAATGEPSLATTSPVLVRTVEITLQPSRTAAPGPAGAPSDGGSARGLLAFAAVAGILVAAIAGAAVWRLRHGA